MANFNYEAMSRQYQQPTPPSSQCGDETSRPASKTSTSQKLTALVPPMMLPQSHQIDAPTAHKVSWFT